VISSSRPAAGVADFLITGERRILFDGIPFKNELNYEEQLKTRRFKLFAVTTKRRILYSFLKFYLFMYLDFQ